MRLTKVATAALLAFGLTGVASAQTIQISITNLTHNSFFTPRLVVAHTDAADLFELGEPASTPLAWLAEAGVIDDEQNAASAGQNFESVLGPVDTDNDTNTWHRFGGFVNPSSTLAYPFDTKGKPLLSIASMIVPSNDAFIGLDSIVIPTEPGTYTFYMDAYDAGTELNDELNSLRTDITGVNGEALGGYGVPGIAGAGLPAIAETLSTGGSGVAVSVGFNEDGTALADPTQVVDGTDGPIHVHRNVLGDTSATAGASDLNSTVHRWLNPVAKVTIVVPAS